MELLNWQDVTLKKGQRDCSHSSRPSVFLTAQCISWLQTPEMFYPVYADVNLRMYPIQPWQKVSIKF